MKMTKTNYLKLKNRIDRFLQICNKYFPELTVRKTWESDTELWLFFDSVVEEEAIINYDYGKHIVYLPDDFEWKDAKDKSQYIGINYKGDSGEWKDGNVLNLKEIEETKLIQEIIDLHKKYKAAIVKNKLKIVEQDFK